MTRVTKLLIILLLLLFQERVRLCYIIKLLVTPSITLRKRNPKILTLIKKSVNNWNTNLKSSLSSLSPLLVCEALNPSTTSYKTSYYGTHWRQGPKVNLLQMDELSVMPKWIQLHCLQWRQSESSPTREMQVPSLHQRPTAFWTRQTFQIMNDPRNPKDNEQRSTQTQFHGGKRQ